jgi:hypothetical protein
MATCGSCSGEVSDSATFCQHCGTFFYEQPKTIGGQILAAIAALIFIFGWVMWVFSGSTY